VGVGLGATNKKTRREALNLIRKHGGNPSDYGLSDMNTAQLKGLRSEIVESQGRAVSERKEILASVRKTASQKGWSKGKIRGLKGQGTQALRDTLARFKSGGGEVTLAGRTTPKAPIPGKKSPNLFPIVKRGRRDRPGVRTTPRGGTPPPGIDPASKLTYPSRPTQRGIVPLKTLAPRKVASRVVGKGPAAKTIAQIASGFTGDKAPVNTSAVRKFLQDLGIVSSSSEIPEAGAQKIADRFRAVPKAKMPEVVGKAAIGAKAAAKGGGLAGVFSFFGVASPTTKPGIVSKAIRVGQTPIGAVGAFSLANAMRQLREGSAIKKELTLAEKMAPSADDMFKQAMLEDLQMTNRLRASSGTGLSPSALSSLLTADEGPVTAVSLPPSSGFPIG
jgi:hypothetical protein